ncbi:hypothetical protein [Nostoc sp. ChiVER01]|uniref:hypothetical protein n=1 Tax=unclassified Nostoc TaxID=2593658 RepID=UPI002AD4516F|nr:hypothetical protein [Nostoc sp. ChiVER01]MDZ8224506.1 hypothetical protein [Nostoc sp. ChiVER01]
MHHSLKIKILDLDHIESIVEQDIRDVEAEKIVGGTLSVSASLVSRLGSEVGSWAVPLHIPPHPPVPLPIPPHPPLVNKVDLQLQIIVKIKELDYSVSRSSEVQF